LNVKALNLVWLDICIVLYFFGLSLRNISKAIQLFEERSYVDIYGIGYINFIQKKHLSTQTKKEEQDNSPFFICLLILYHLLIRGLDLAEMTFRIDFLTLLNKGKKMLGLPLIQYISI
jgi:hypothetical protein